MKKIISCIFIVLLVLTCMNKTFAAQYDIIKMEIELPETYYNLTKGLEQDDKKMDYYVALMSTSKEALKSEYAANSILYNGISKDMANEIYLSYAENKLTQSIFHLSSAEDKQLAEVKDEITKTIKAQNMVVTAQDTYVLGDMTFVHTEMKKGTTTIYQYYTIVNGKSITLSLNSSDGSAKNEDLKKIVNTITFDEIEEKPTSFKTYMLIAVTALLVIMVIVLVFMAFFGGKKSIDVDDEDVDEEEENKEE
ncbi:MAG: hypothetical protein IKP28_05035 [Clostridia bacterium]|nr:hypothetical protein [Clostridia bacterium]